MEEEWILLRQLSEDPLTKLKHRYFSYNERIVDPLEAALRGPLTKLKHTYFTYLRLADAMPSPDACVGRAALKPEI